MLYVSISRTDAAPRPTARAVSRIRMASRSRSGSGSRLESSTPAMARRSGGMMTAHATTGPARGPRPTSSTPASSGPWAARSSRSIPLHRFRRPPMVGRPPPNGSRRDGPPSLLGRRGLRHLHAHLALADAGRLAREVPQVVELGATHPAAPHHGDLGDHRTVQREDALHP